MRVTVILLIVAAVIFGMQSSYYRKKAGENLVLAVKKMPADPDGAVKQFRDVFGYGHLVTFGFAAKTGDAFYANMGEKTLGAVPASEALDPGAFVVLRDNLRVLSEQAAMPERNPHRKAEAAILRILTGLKELEPSYREKLRLPAWDAFLNVLKECRSRGWADGALASPGASPSAAGFAEWAEAAAAVDRRPIGLRTALQIGAECLAEGASALGGTPYAPDPPLLFALPAPPDSPSLVKADVAFERGKAALELYPRQFPGEVPPAVEMAWAKITLNLGAMRTAHLEAEGQKLLSEASEYFAHIFIKPNTEVIPSEAEMHGAFVNAVAGNLDQSAKVFEKLASAGEPGAAVLAAAARRAGERFARVLGRRTAGEFEAARSRMLAAPGGAEWAEVISGDGAAVFALK